MIRFLTVWGEEVMILIVSLISYHFEVLAS